MPKSVVPIGKGANAEEPASFTFGHRGGMGAIMKPGASVVIKPNAGHRGGV